MKTPISEHATCRRLGSVARLVLTAAAALDTVACEKKPDPSAQSAPEAPNSFRLGPPEPSYIIDARAKFDTDSAKRLRMERILSEGAIRDFKPELQEANSRLATVPPEEKAALQSRIDELKRNLARAEGMVQGCAETIAWERKQWEDEKWAGYGKRSLERPIVPVRTPPPSLSAAGRAAHGDFWARVDAKGEDFSNKLKLIESKRTEYQNAQRSAKLIEQMKAAAAEEQTLMKARYAFDRESKVNAAAWNARNWEGYVIPDAFPEKSEAAPPPSPPK